MYASGLEIRSREDQECGAHPLSQNAGVQSILDGGSSRGAQPPRHTPQGPVGRRAEVWEEDHRTVPVQLGQDVLGCGGGTKDPRCHSCAPPRTAEVPSEDTKDHYYKLPISREDIHFLASWEGLSRHKEELLQVGRRLQAAQQAPGLCAQQH